jgi:hypothetical protein
MSVPAGDRMHRDRRRLDSDAFGTAGLRLVRAAQLKRITRVWARATRSTPTLGGGIARQTSSSLSR